MTSIDDVAPTGSQERAAEVEHIAADLDRTAPHDVDVPTGRTRTTATLAHVRKGSRYLRPVRGYAGPLLILVLLILWLTITQPFFWTTANIYNILDANSVLMIASVGMTLSLVSGGFDFSIGSAVVMSGLTYYYATAVWHFPPSAAALVVLGAAFIVGGLVNGVLIGVFRLNFFIVTFGSSSILLGLAFTLTNGSTKEMSADGFLQFLSSRLNGFPVDTFVAAGVVILGMILLRLTRLGRSIYAVGGNAEAARLSGIRTERTVIIVYAMSALCAAAAGIVFSARIGGADPNSGSDIALSSAAACLLGGKSFGGGSSLGGLTGTVVGVLLIGVLNDGLGLIGVVGGWQDIITGVVLIMAVLSAYLNRDRAVAQT